MRTRGDDEIIGGIKLVGGEGEGSPRSPPRPLEGEKRVVESLVYYADNKL